MNVKISVSLTSADLTNIRNDLKILSQNQIDYLHFDVMDGNFVPNFTMGPHILNNIHRLTHIPIDTHLMIVEPIRYIEPFIKAGSKIITVHYEACTHLHRTIMAIKNHKIKAGVSLNPSTPVWVLEEILPELDLVLIMSVNPGFGGQKFIPESVKKIKKLRNLIDKNNLKTDIEVDGGINKNNIQEIIEAGANILVGGASLIFIPGTKLITNVRNLKKILKNYQ